MFNRINLTDRALPLHMPRLRYDEGAPAGAAPAPTPTPAPAPATPTPTPTPVATPAPTSAAWDGKIESLDPAAQKIISDLRKEAADNRVKATTLEQRQAAILAAAGIVDETDPVEAAKKATAERDAATTAAASAARELAIFKASHSAGADPVKLLDRASFLTSVSGIDPKDGPAIAAAIKAAVDADATLKAGRAPGASSIPTPGGPGEQGQITEEQLAHMTDEEIVAAQNKGLLRNLLS